MSMRSQIITAEDQLRLLRAGYAKEHLIKFGKLELPCRLMPASEEAAIIANAKKGVKLPSEEPENRRLAESMAVMKSILLSACTVDGTPHVSLGFLDQLTDVELDSLYDQFLTLKECADPDMEKLSPAQIGELFEAVKKKERRSKDFFTWELAAIGKFCLDRLPLEDSVPGI